MEPNESNVVSEDSPREKPAFFDSGHLDRVLGFGKLVGINIIKMVLVCSLGLLFILSAYKLFYQYGLLTMIYHMAFKGTLRASSVPREVWTWLITFVLSWASLLASLERRL